MKKINSKSIIGVKELREHLSEYISQVKKGKTFTVVRRSTPVFKITPVEEKEENWEAVVDFTKIKKGGININDILSRL